MFRDTIAKIVAGILLFLFWLTVGVACSPFWLLMVIIGVLLQVFPWREAPRKWWGLTMIKWFFD